MRFARPLLLLATLVPGCGAKTGLLIPDAEVPIDAPRDAGLDARCPDVPIELRRPEVETTFVIDGSGSMAFTWDGLPGGVGLPSRWEIVRDTFAEVLPPFDSQIAIGAKIFPDGPGCEVSSDLEIRPHLRASGELLDLFGRWTPEGGTPTADALRRTLIALPRDPEIVRVIVATLDGGPNCNEDTGVPPETCICTGPRRACLQPPPEGPRACLDAERTLEVTRQAYEERGIPVVVVGIDDPSRPELSAFLDEMAIAGGWARPEGSGRRFYIAREPEDLRVAFGEIVELISRCVFVAPAPPPEGAIVEVRIGGMPVPRDTRHVDGWDWTDRAAGALAFFGPTCDALRISDDVVTANLICAE